MIRTDEKVVDTQNPLDYSPRQMDPATLSAELAKRGLTTQEMAAQALGVQQAAISKWTLGQRRIPPMVAVALKAIPTVQDARKTPSRRSRKSSTNKP